MWSGSGVAIGGAATALISWLRNGRVFGVSWDLLGVGGAFLVIGFTGWLFLRQRG